ncbi:hypothetical protein Tfu_0770 [Thermobifida fusca YX]|uniref:Uncharacterized protein n=1 Tax=Thermobifida fusca (strain YX) TaxID=269800 RepID=Q47RV9_THEFY|nr:hypothetical protein Tfu_0770 [Thermobifida fusca YX]
MSGGKFPVDHRVELRGVPDLNSAVAGRPGGHALEAAVPPPQHLVGDRVPFVELLEHGVEGGDRREGAAAPQHRIGQDVGVGEHHQGAVGGGLLHDVGEPHHVGGPGPADPLHHVHVGVAPGRHRVLLVLVVGHVAQGGEPQVLFGAPPGLGVAFVEDYAAVVAGVGPVHQERRQLRVDGVGELVVGTCRGRVPDHQDAQPRGRHVEGDAQQLFVQVVLGGGVASGVGKVHGVWYFLVVLSTVYGSLLLLYGIAGR